MRRLRILVVPLLFLLAASQAAFGQAQPQTVEIATVVTVIDGDTIDVQMQGKTYRVRYIGINTPESSEVCGGSAMQANAALVLGKTVAMFRDVGDTDRYDRLLRYVFVGGGTFVNAALVAEGWAEAVAYPPDTRFADYFELLEAAAAGLSIGCHRFGVFTGTSAVVATPTPARTPTPMVTAGVTVTAANNMNLRNGPGTNYSVVGTLAAGQTMRAEARNGDWLYLTNGMWVAGWLVTVQGSVASLPTRAAPAAPAGAVAPAAPAAPAQPVQPVQPAAPAFVCNCSKTCPQMSSCEEAYFQLLQCGCRKRDGDGDGVPCEDICPGG